jgi:hypothetical protein
MTREEFAEEINRKKITLFANMSEFEKDCYDNLTSGNREILNNLLVSVFLSGEQSGIAISQKIMKEAVDDNR